jgi:hypothetical protein
MNVDSEYRFTTPKINRRWLLVLGALIAVFLTVSLG